MSQIKKNTLGAMPDVVMKNILEHCNYDDIQCLRKSCSRLRGLVDLIKPSPKVQCITCVASGSDVAIKLTFFNEQSTSILYFKTPGGYTVKGSQAWNVEGRSFNTNTPLDEVICDDFKILKSSLTHQPTPLNWLTLDFQEDSSLLFYDSILSALTERPFLRITNLLLDTESSCHLYRILQFVSAEALKSVTMKITGDERYANTQLSWVAGLQQWKHVQTLRFEGLRIPETRLLETIPWSVSRMVWISPEQVARLKETFLNSPTFHWCSIELDDVGNRLDSLSLIVPDIENDPEESMWFYKSPRPGKVLRVGHDGTKMTFDFVDTARLEEDDIVRD